MGSSKPALHVGAFAQLGWRLFIDGTVWGREGGKCCLNPSTATVAKRLHVPTLLLGAPNRNGHGAGAADFFLNTCLCMH